ncbi:MAG: hypothetical protein MRY78_00890 [Saprospiraceae bacterium]|nr:hypothetical protein [Saprospiraceae bacterium]
MIKELAIILSDISMYSVVLPALVGFIRIRKLQLVQKAVFALALLSVLTEVIARLVRHMGNAQNIVYYGYTALEFGLLAIIFAQALPPYLTRRSVLAISFAFVGFVVLDMVWLSGVEQFNNYSTAVESLILIFFSLVFFYKTLQELQIRYLEKAPLFWISVGVLLYFSGSLFIFLFTNYVNSSNQALFIIWGIHGIFGILLNLFYALALWTKPDQ